MLNYTVMLIGPVALLIGFTCGYYSFVWGNLETMRSKKQPVVSRSIAEAEFRSLSNGICEDVWLKMVLNELKMGDSHPIEMMCDHQAALQIV